MRRITDRGFLMLNIAKSLLIVTVLNHFTATRQHSSTTIRWQLIVNFRFSFAFLKAIYKTETLIECLTKILWRLENTSRSA
jgi:hypothetical protein